MVMMSAWTVYVAVCHFISSCFTNTHYFNGEVKFNACERMVRVNSDLFKSNFCNRNNAALVG